jgi:hypothetical protein
LGNRNLLSNFLISCCLVLKVAKDKNTVKVRKWAQSRQRNRASAHKQI